jgi:hypothetical protein
LYHIHLNQKSNSFDFHSFKKKKTIKVLARIWRKEKFVHCWWDYRAVQPLSREVQGFLKTLKIELQYDLAMPLLNMSKGNEINISKKYVPICILAALFAITK